MFDYDKLTVTLFVVFLIVFVIRSIFREMFYCKIREIADQYIVESRTFTFRKNGLMITYNEGENTHTIWLNGWLLYDDGNWSKTSTKESRKKILAFIDEEYERVISEKREKLAKDKWIVARQVNELLGEKDYHD